MKDPSNPDCCKICQEMKKFVYEERWKQQIKEAKKEIKCETPT